MKIKIEIIIDVLVEEGGRYHSGLENTIISSISEKTGLKEELIYINDYEVKQTELIKE